MGILLWRGRVSKKEFRRQYLEALRAAMPGCECRPAPDDDLVILVSGSPRHEALTQRLHNAYSEFKKEPATRDAIFARCIAGIAALVDPPPLASENIVPILKSTVWLENAYEPGPVPPDDDEDAMIVDRHNEHLIVVYSHFAESFSFPSRRKLAEAGIAFDGLRELALANLRRMTPGRRFIALDGAYLIGVGGNLEASLLLDDTLWTDEPFAGAETIVAAVPDRNSILATTDASVDGIWLIASMARQLELSEPYSISSQLFIRSGGAFVALNAADADDSHPIPRLDVLDVVAQRDNGPPDLGLVIAAPLGAEPRSVFRLFRKLVLYLAELEREVPPLHPTELAPCTLWITVHPESHPAVIAKIESLGAFFAERAVTLKLKVGE